MNSITQTKGLGDIRTIISTHTRSVPRHKGSLYLDILSVGMEKLRLETELAWLARRQRRIDGRLEEIREAMSDLADQAKAEGAAPPSDPAAAGSKRGDGNIPSPRRWPTLAIEY